MYNNTGHKTLQIKDIPADAASGTVKDIYPGVEILMSKPLPGNWYKNDGFYIDFSREIASSAG